MRRGGWADDVGDRVLAYTRVTGFMLRAVFESALSWREKLRCVVVVARDWTWDKRRSIASDVRHFVTDLRSTS